MEQRFEQNLKLSLQLKLTPGVYLHLEVLQLPLLKLEEAVKNEIEENPFLELEEGEETGRPERNEEIPDFIFEGGNVFPVEEEREAVIPAKLSLRESLLQQARAELDEEEFRIAKMIIDNLNERGFLTLSESEIAENLSVPEKTVRHVRETVKRLSPAGCGSYSVKEAFKVQLEELEAQKSSFQHSMHWSFSKKTEKSSKRRQD